MDLQFTYTTGHAAKMNRILSYYLLLTNANGDIIKITVFKLETNHESQAGKVFEN